MVAEVLLWQLPVVVVVLPGVELGVDVEVVLVTGVLHTRI